MSITVRPIVFTAHPDRWQRMLTALGARVVVERPGWTVLACAGGRVAVHDVDDGDHLAGTVRLAFEVPDLEAFHTERAVAVASAGAVIEREAAGHGELLRVTAPDGTVLQVDRAEPGGDTAPSASCPAVMPLWYTPEPARARAVLEALGLVAHIAADSGGWVDLTAPAGGGRHAVHHAEASGSELSFEHDDVAALAETVAAAGVAVDVVDESYGRSARVAGPEAPDDLAARVWVNEAQRDLYGYRVEAPG